MQWLTSFRPGSIFRSWLEICKFWTVTRGSCGDVSYDRTSNCIVSAAKAGRCCSEDTNLVSPLQTFWTLARRPLAMFGDYFRGLLALGLMD